jgi:hypothetical protein
VIIPEFLGRWTALYVGCRSPGGALDVPGPAPVIENKREKDSNRLIGYLSSRVSWPSLVTVPFTGDAAVCAQLIECDAHWRRRLPSNE